MRHQPAFKCLLLAPLLFVSTAQAAPLSVSANHVPYGCYPVRISVQSDFSGTLLTLDGTVPDVNYLVLMRTNKLFGCWRRLTLAGGAKNTTITLIRMPRVFLPPNAILAAGSGEDTDGDFLPDLYEDLATRTDPLAGNTGGMDDCYRMLSGDGWTSQQKYDKGWCDGPILTFLPAACDSEGIRHTIRKVHCDPVADGFSLTVDRPRAGANYLMLVRDGPQGFWKASGYFVGNTNGIKLKADKRGMLQPAGCPYVLPGVEHVPILAHPEFIAGSGEDADGDGLPDIYEVLVTKTEPDNVDTGGKGIFDGYKNPAGDGWTNLEKFRRRANPFAPDLAHAPIVLNEPMLAKEMQAYMSMKQTDLQFEVIVEMTNLGTGQKYSSETGDLPMLGYRAPYAVMSGWQVRISEQVPKKKHRERHSW